MWLIIVTASMLVRAVLGNEQTNHITELDVRDATASNVGGLANERNRSIVDREVENIPSDSDDLWKQRRGGSWKADAISPSEQSDRSNREKNAKRYESGESDRVVGIVLKRSPEDWRTEKEIHPINDRREDKPGFQYWCVLRLSSKELCVCRKRLPFNMGGGKRRKRNDRWNIDSPTKRSDPEIEIRDRFSAPLHKYRDLVGYASELNDIKRVAEMSRVGWKVKTPFNSWGGKRAGKWMKADGKGSGLLSPKVPNNADPLNVAQGKLEGRNRWEMRETKTGDTWQEGWTNQRGNGQAIRSVEKAEKSNSKEYASPRIVKIYSKGLQLDSSAGQTHAFLRGARNAKQVTACCRMKTLNFVGHKKTCKCDGKCTWEGNPYDIDEVKIVVHHGKPKKFHSRRYYWDTCPDEFGAATVSPSGFNGIKRVAEINRVQSRIPFNSWRGKRAHRFSKLPNTPRFRLTKDEFLVNTNTDTDASTSTDTDTDTDTDTSASDQIRKRERIDWQNWGEQRRPFLSWIPFHVYNQTTGDGYDTLEKAAQQEEEEERGVDDWNGWMPEKKAEQHGQYKKTKFDPWGGKRSLKLCWFPPGKKPFHGTLDIIDDET